MILIWGEWHLCFWAVRENSGSRVCGEDKPGSYIMNQKVILMISGHGHLIAIGQYSSNSKIKANDPSLYFSEYPCLRATAQFGGTENGLHRPSWGLATLLRCRHTLTSHFHWLHFLLVPQQHKGEESTSLLFELPLTAGQALWLLLPFPQGHCSVSRLPLRHYWKTWTVRFLPSLQVRLQASLSSGTLPHTLQALWRLLIN